MLGVHRLAAGTLTTLAVSMLTLTGCGAFGAEAEATPPPDAVQVRVYTNGGERFPESVKWRFQSAGVADQTGVVTWIPEGTCIFLGPVWTLQVATDQDIGDPLLNAAATSGNFSGESPLNLAIEWLADGRVTVTEGIPDWWDSPRPIGCASN